MSPMNVDKKEKAPTNQAEAAYFNARTIVGEMTPKKKAKQAANMNPIKSALENREKLEPGMSFLDYVAGIVDMTKGKDLKARIREQAAQLEAGGLADKRTATALLWAIRKTFEQEDKKLPPWLADVDPWPEDVGIKDVITEIEELVRQVVYCAPETATAIAYFIAVTWFAESLPEVAPYALITSAQKRCGKSTLMALMGELVFHPLLASNLSPPSLFRAVDAYHPTLLLDECDTYLGTDPDLIGMINCGYKRPLAKELRVNKLYEV